MARFLDKLQELRDCCDESVRALDALATEPEIQERVAERRMFVMELSAILRQQGQHSRSVGDSLRQVWHAAGRAVKRVLHGALDDLEDLEQTLLRRYERACEAAPMSVACVLLRQHDALKRADFHRRGQPDIPRQPAESGPRRSWPQLATFGRSLGVPTSAR